MQKIKVNNQEIDVEVVDTDASRALGLQFRDKLNHGMLFVLDKPEFVSFHMKNVKFPLDMYFVNEDCKIVKKIVARPSQEALECNNVKYVLETTIDKLDAEEDDSIVIPSVIISKIAREIIAQNNLKIIEDDELARSCKNLKDRNNGLFASDKQAKFFQWKINSGKPIESNDRQYLASGDLGIVSSKQIDKGKFLNQYFYVLDEKGVRLQYSSSWVRSGEGLIYQEAKERVDREFDNMDFRSRERNWGLQTEMIQELMKKWKYINDKIWWKRQD